VLPSADTKIIRTHYDTSCSERSGENKSDIQRDSSERSAADRIGGREMRMEYKNKTQQMTVRCGVIFVPLLEPQNCMQYS
jgi:hypothetical protein